MDMDMDMVWHGITSWNWHDMTSQKLWLHSNIHIMIKDVTYMILSFNLFSYLFRYSNELLCGCWIGCWSWGCNNLTITCHDMAWHEHHNFHDNHKLELCVCMCDVVWYDMMNITVLVFIIGDCVNAATAIIAACAAAGTRFNSVAASVRSIKERRRSQLDHRIA